MNREEYLVSESQPKSCNGKRSVYIPPDSHISEFQVSTAMKISQSIYREYVGVKWIGN